MNQILAGKFRRRTSSIDAFRFGPDVEVPQWFRERMELDPFSVKVYAWRAEIFSPFGWQEAVHDDWICLDSDGSLFVVRSDSFEKMYEPLAKTPK